MRSPSGVPRDFAILSKEGIKIQMLSNSEIALLRIETSTRSSGGGFTPLQLGR